ncbi:MAG TPA: AGE family epimerase/isomerase [Lachnospiraceae bacterium]|nr:AGE family epimerase/isomerase [Lachnospiraceae bacterium]
MLINEVKDMLVERIIPFWRNLKDTEYGGYYGLLDYNLHLQRTAEKGCILNSRILWFFSNAYMTLGDKMLLEDARHSFDFMVDHCFDKENGGVYWSLNYDGSVKDSTKHTYNQAFAIYALSSFYDASKEEKALVLAKELFHVVETKCKDEVGYLEAFKKDFSPANNDKLSENGILAEKTMNTLLHVFEAYTELYRVSHMPEVKEQLVFILDTIANKIYNKDLTRQEVFFDRNLNPILDLHSYGHDIETAWLVDRGCEVLQDEEITKRMSVITLALTKKIYDIAYVNHSVLNECDRGKVNTLRIWWVQAEGVVGFLNGYEKTGKEEYLQAAADIWNFIKEFVLDKREGSEWFWAVDENGIPLKGKPIVEPWKCPYHNGRMCFEVIRRNIDVTC